MAATFCRNFLSFPFCRLCDTGVNLSNLKVWEHPGENKRQKNGPKVYRNAHDQHCSLALDFCEVRDVGRFLSQPQLNVGVNFC